MAKIYQKQNPNLSRGPILQPMKPSTYSAQIRAATNIGTTALDRVAVENWTLGYSNMVNDIVTQAYEAHPTDLAKFNDMVESGVLKATEKLPGSLSRKLRAGVETKALALQGKIKNNQIDVMNAEQKKKVMVSLDDITGNGPMGMQSLNELMMDAFINKDEETAAAARKAWDVQHERLKNIAEIKDGRGNYVIGKEAERNMYKQGLFGKEDAFRAAIERLPADGLKSFDEDVFQNKEHFMKAYNVDYKTYDNMEKLIKARRKAFDDSDKRIIKSQDYFNLSQVASVPEDVLSDIETRGTVPQDTLDLIKKAKKQAEKIGANESAAYNFGDQNQGFLAGIMELQNAISTDDGSPQYADNLLKSAANASIQISKMHQMGLGDEQAEILQKALSGIVSNQDFAQALDMNDSSLLSEIARGAKNDFDKDINRQEEVIRKKYPLAEKDAFQKSLMESELSRLPQRTQFKHALTDRPVQFTENTNKALKQLAARYTSAIIALENSGQHEEAMNMRNQANKELIYLKYADWIPRQEFDRLEKELKNGKDAYTMIGNSVYQYKGLSQNGIILKGEF
jgi:hypothetical protein